jgi:hypothetical protein
MPYRIIITSDRPLTRADTAYLGRRLRQITASETQRSEALRTGDSATSRPPGPVGSRWNRWSFRRWCRMLGKWLAAVVPAARGDGAANAIQRAGVPPLLEQETDLFPSVDRPAENNPLRDRWRLHGSGWPGDRHRGRGRPNASRPIDKSTQRPSLSGFSVLLIAAFACHVMSTFRSRLPKT